MNLNLYIFFRYRKDCGKNEYVFVNHTFVCLEIKHILQKQEYVNMMVKSE